MINFEHSLTDFGERLGIYVCMYICAYIYIYIDTWRATKFNNVCKDVILKSKLLTPFRNSATIWPPGKNELLNTSSNAVRHNNTTAVRRHHLCGRSGSLEIDVKL